MRARQASATANPTGPFLAAETERTDPRIALEREVVLQIHDRPRQLCSLANISANGMFVRSPDLQPAGRTLNFELSLSRRQQLVRGEGEVVWSRRFNLSPDLPAGMGIRFLRLDGRSRKIMRSMIDDRCEETPAAVAGPRAPFSGLTSSEQSKLHAYAGCAAAKAERRWPRRLRGLLSLAARAARKAMLL